MARLHNPIRFFTDEELYAIHQTSLQILENPGIRIDHPEGLKLLQDAGAQVSYKDKVAKIPSHLMEEVMKKTRGDTWELHGTEHSVKIGGEDIIFMTYAGRIRDTRIIRFDGSCAYVLDLEAKERRIANSKDVVDGIRLNDALKNIRVVSFPVNDQTLAPELRTVHGAADLVKNTTKPGGIDIFDVNEAKYVLRIAEAVAGGKEELRKKPILTTFVELNSPLTIDDRTVDLIMMYTKEHLPIGISTMPITGLTGPCTLAGDLALANAEVWAGIGIAKLTDPDAPVQVFPGPDPLTYDMRTCSALYSGVERGMFYAGKIQLYAEFYNIPSGSTGFKADAPLPGIQATYEKLMSGLLPILAGATEVGNIGYVDHNLTYSPEQTVLDCEMADMIDRVIRGIEVNEETLALDVIRQVGIKGNFLMHKHTSKHAKTEFWYPEFANRLYWDTWKKRGSKDILDAAKAKVESVLKTHDPKPLDRATEKEVDAIVKEADLGLMRT